MNSEISAGLIADILGCFGIPTNTVKAIYDSILENRKKEALEILLMEIRQGDFSGIDSNETVSVISRYLRDAVEGAARNNLKLLARTIHGMADKEELVASSFNRYASVLASLSDPEINLLGFLAKRNIGDYLSDKKELDKKFGEYKVQGMFQALMRTGLVTFSQGVDTKYEPEHDDDYGIYEASASSESWTNYETTDLFEEILKYTKFFDV